MPTISINKTEGCQVYLSKESLNCEIISAKSSEMNILVPQEDEDYVSEHFNTQFHFFASLACLEWITSTAFEWKLLHFYFLY